MLELCGVDVGVLHGEQKLALYLSPRTVGTAGSRHLAEERSTLHVILTLFTINAKM
jgi:hypothetical protein